MITSFCSFACALLIAILLEGVIKQTQEGSKKAKDRQYTYRGADKSLARPGKKQARGHVRDARDFNNIETRAIIKLFSLHGKAPTEINVILRET